MTDAPASTIAAALSGADIGVIVHIGAGRCSELDQYLASSAKQIHLIEPNPALARELRSTSARDGRVTVHEMAIAASAGGGTLNVFNLTRLSSLRLPKDIKELFPGLRMVSQLDVRTTPLSHFVGDAARIRDADRRPHHRCAR